MRPPAVLPLIIAVLMMAVATPLWAQDSSPDFEPAISQSGQTFQDIANSHGQRTDVRYLHQDSKPELRKADEPSNDQNFRSGDPGLRGITAIFLIVLVGVLVWLWWRNSAGGGLFARSTKLDEPGNEEYSQAADGFTLGDEGQYSYADLAEINDPKEGMRKLMISALLSAAADNKIAVRRSLTTRDVLRRVPGSWQRKPILQELVGRAELVLFGGRPIDNQQFADLLEFAKPLFGKAGR